MPLHIDAALVVEGDAFVAQQVFHDVRPAEYLGTKSAARTVGWALNGAKGTGLPAHRVVNRYGALSGWRYFGGPQIMEDLLRNEGITFDDEGCVEMERHLWIPGGE